MTDSQLLQLDIDQLEPNPLQARGLIHPDSLADLVQSIKAHGVLEPIVVAQTPAGYQIIAGERRWRASKLAGLTKVPVIVKETSARGMLELAIVENVQREDLNPIERGQAFKRLGDEFGLTYAEIGERVGKSEAYVANTVRLLHLPDAIKDGLISELISEGHAKAIAGLSDPKLMVEAYKIILAENSTVRVAEDIVKRLKAETHQAPKTSVEGIYNPEVKRIEKEMAEIMGKNHNAKVKVIQTKTSVKVFLQIYGDQITTSQKLQEIYSKLIN